MQDLHSIYSSPEGRYHHPLNLLNPVNPLNPHTEGVSKAAFALVTYLPFHPAVPGRKASWLLPPFCRPHGRRLPPHAAASGREHLIPLLWLRRNGSNYCTAPCGSCPGHLLMCDKEAIEVQKILPFLSDTWPLCRIGRAVIRASQSCRQSCNKSQCPACGCRSHHSCTHAPQFSRSFPAREWGSVLQRQGACGQCP